jgi:hypothetical protein
LITKETDSAVTVRTINDTVVVPKSDIEEQRLSDLSLMPDRLLDTFKPEEIRDLVAYLASPAQVALKGPRAPIDRQTGRVAEGQEGESLPVLSKSRGNAAPQAMGAFAADRWSGNSQVWWTGGQPGDRLELEITAERSQEYTLELVMTRARDYGIVQLSLDSQKLGAPLDLYNAPEVITTGVISFDNLVLSSGPHRLQVEIIGANPQAVPAYMFGLDYARLVSPAEPGKQ